MTGDPADILALTLTRIERRDEATSATASGPWTGVLADLHQWWVAVSGGAALRPAAVPTDPIAAPQAAVAAVAAGIAAADRAVDSGATLLIPRVDDREDTTARAIIGLLAKREPSAILDQPEGMPDAEWMDRCARIRDEMAAQAHLRGDYLGLLEALDAHGVGTVAGILLGAAARRTPCLLDGTDEWAGALVADRLHHSARSWWRVAVTSTDPARSVAGERIGLAAGIPLTMADDLGLGAEATLALLRLVDEPRAI